MIKRKHFLFALNISTLVLLFCIDRLSKAWALRSLHETRVLIPQVLQLSLVQNTKIVFWLFWPEWLMLTIVGVVIIVVVTVGVQAVYKKNYWLASALALILIGAYSNFWDRVWLHAVTDFISVPFWSVCNLADIYIVCGVVAAAALMHFDKTPKKASL